MSELTKRANYLNNSKKLNKLSKKSLLSVLLICFILEFIESRVKILSPPELKNMFGGMHNNFFLNKIKRKSTKGKFIEFR